ncbi:ferredoxin reductase domain-containing protein [Salinispora fenicalii]|uniref:membrane protein n=1 Tax=Salinispora fenicalii TaxID=1137263 RepID=UPI000484EDE6|nr:membrane protein [Salinispora fenicalii]
MTTTPLKPPPAPLAIAAATDAAHSARNVKLPPRLPLPQRIFTHPALMHYHRLIAVVLVVNLGLAGYGIGAGGWSTAELPTSQLAGLTLANFTLAIVIRQQYVINLFFWLATRARTSWPLRIRRTLGKVYHFGGLHVGGALAGTLWFLAFTATATGEAIRSGSGLPATLVVTYLLVALLLTVCGTALPPVRARHHDLFERVHRFGGWLALTLFWVLTVLQIAADSAARPLATALLTEASIWALALMTFSVALPWLRLRKVPVAVERPSTHVALVQLERRRVPFPGSSTAVSRSPLLEWHSFANVPAPGHRHFRITISRAGDWTGALVDNPPSHLWVKGITTAGVANIETLFTKVVYVATGSGIGPVLPHLLADEVPSHLVWAVRSPRTTYGDALIDEILAARPSATIWDTATDGKPDMVALAYHAYREHGAEAVICISNKKLTWQVVHGLEQRGIPAYGAIWDS